MPYSPPTELVELLERLGLATSGQVASVAPAVRRLAGQLPPFESVWIDALAQRRLLTPFQATQLIGGRGEQLLVGAYTIQAKIATPAWAESFLAVNRQTNETAELLLIRSPADQRANLLRSIEKVIQQTQLLSDQRLCCLSNAGPFEQGVWVSSRGWQGKPIDQWLVEHGRMPAQAVMHIVREVLEALIQLQQVELLHTGLAPSALVIDNAVVRLRHPCLRALIRPGEGYALADLPPSGYDGVSPERIAEGTGCGMASEMFALGALTWHLLTGRPAFAGGNGLTKLRAIHDARPGNLRLLVPDAPPGVFELVTRCLQHDPQARPKSWEELVTLLGPPDASERSALLHWMNDPGMLFRARSARRKSSRLRNSLAGAAVAIACITGLWCYPWPAPATATVSLIPRKSIALNLVPSRRAESTAHTENHSGVRLASASEPISHSPNDSTNPIGAPPPLLLPADRVVELVEIELTDGQIVRPADGRRATVRVPRDGLLIKAENVRFENLDFVWDAHTPAARADSAKAALIVAQADRCEFRGCTFQATANTTVPTAILWQTTTGSRPESRASAQATLVLSSCHAYGLDAVIQIDRQSSATIDLSNSLLHECAAVCRLHAFPPLGSSVSILLEHSTLRDTGSLCVVATDDLPDQPGMLSFHAGGSVLTVRDGDPLVALVGKAPDKALLSFLRWQGEGSLVPAEAPVAAWQQPSGLSRPADESLLQVGGLVRGEAEFASSNPGMAASSRIASWQAPLRSPRAPGISAGVPDLPLLP